MRGDEPQVHRTAAPGCLSSPPMTWSFSLFFNQRLRQRHGCQLLIPKETDHCR